MHLKQGDIVRYIGSNPRIQKDYGDRNLVVVNVNSNCLTVCQDSAGDLLVGAYCHELEVVRNLETQIDTERDADA